MKILIVHNAVPDSARSGASLRLTKLIESMHRLGHSITLVSVNRAASQSSVKTLWKMGVQVYDGVGRNLRDTGGRSVGDLWLAQLVEKEGFALAILCLWYWNSLSVPERYLNTIRKSAPRTMIAILSDDRHGERQAQIAALNPSFVEAERSLDIIDREAETYRNGDCVISISDREKNGVLRLAPELKCFIVPFSIPPQKSKTTFAERVGICFLGNFANDANRAAYDILLRTILPLMRHQLGSVSLTVGGCGSEELYKGGMRDVSLVGFVPDLAMFFQKHKVFLSPTPFGTGITTKVAVALSHSIPVVTTPSGCQSLDAESGTHLLCTDNPQNLAKMAVTLYSDEELWNRLSCNGLDLTRTTSSEDVDRSLRNFLEWISIQPTKAQNREVNWSVMRGFDEGILNPPNSRNLSSLYITVGNEELKAGNPTAALKQFRHALTEMRRSSKGHVQITPLYMALVYTMAKAYSQLGDVAALERTQLELRWCKRHLRLEVSDEV